MGKCSEDAADGDDIAGTYRTLARLCKPLVDLRRCQTPLAALGASARSRELAEAHTETPRHQSAIP